MKIICIIPARMASSRFFGKPMKKINGIPMIEEVYRNVKSCKLLNETIVATCDKEIKDHINSLGGIAIMTSTKHERASDRCAEALEIIEKSNNTKYDIVVMVQGDEPLVHPQMIVESVQPLINDNSVQITNLLGEIKSRDEFENKNCIKVVCDKNLNAIYFSREPIPSFSKKKHKYMKKQICIIPFRRDFLKQYLEMTPTILEEIESIDMMRIIEHGFKVKMVPTKFETFAVDTEKDLLKVENILKKKN